MTSNSENSWCVLRTASRHTLQLAESLTADGYDAWTPTEVRMVRVPRKNVKREVRLPIMPSYVFARSHRLVDLIVLAGTPVKPRTDVGARVDFTVMRAFGEIPLVPDAHLTALRHIEFTRTPKRKAASTFIHGATVKVDGGSFGGMVGSVEQSDRGHTLVCFNGRYSVKIPTLLLKADGVSDGDGIALPEAA